MPNHRALHVTHDPRTHRTSAPAGPASLRWNCLRKTSLIDSGVGSTQPCSSFSTGWCCWRTPSCRPGAHSAQCHTRWRCPWAGQIPAASAVGQSRAAQRTDFLWPSSAPPCMWQNGTARPKHITAATPKSQMRQNKKGNRFFLPAERTQPGSPLVLLSPCFCLVKRARQQLWA